jgi:hypothetical protein
MFIYRFDNIKTDLIHNESETCSSANARISAITAQRTVFEPARNRTTTPRSLSSQHRRYTDFTIPGSSGSVKVWVAEQLSAAEGDFVQKKLSSGIKQRVVR